MKKMNKKGFTLIEMLAVIAIIAVLVAIIVPAVGSSTLKAKASTDAANLRSVLSAATIEYASNGLNDDGELVMTLDVPAAKSVDAESIEIYMVGSELVAYYTDGDNYYDLEAFSAVAEAKTTTTGEGENATTTTITTVNPLGADDEPTAANKVWPAA